MPTSSAEPQARPNRTLEVVNLAAGYGGSPIISGVSIDVGRSEVVAVIGPNGAGKSTLLKAIVGVIRSISGSVRLDDRDVTNLRTDELARMGIGYVPQSRDVFDTLTVHENLKMGGYSLERAEIPARVEEVLGIFPSLRPLLARTAHKLSGGERKLVAIARVMLIRPSVYVLDEPTSNLSADLAAELLHDHVARIKERGAAVLLVEQKAKAALEVADWAYLLVAGAVRMSVAAAVLLADDSVGEMFLGQAVQLGSTDSTTQSDQG